MSQTGAKDMGHSHHDAIFTSRDLGEVMHLHHFGPYLLRDRVKSFRFQSKSQFGPVTGRKAQWDALAPAWPPQGPCVVPEVSVHPMDGQDIGLYLAAV